MVVYLDMCAIQRPLDNREHLRVRAEAEAILSVFDLVRAGKVALVASDALFFEAARTPDPTRRDATLEVLRLATREARTNEGIVARVEEYLQAGIKRLDALHLASAVEASADFFCTSDDRLLKRARNVNTERTAVVTPLELIAGLD